jgi:hypothetical protein
MMRRLVIALGLALTLVVLNGGAAGAGDSKRPPPPRATGAVLTASTTPSGTHFLRGERAFDNGVPSYIFGTNDTIDYNSPNVDTLPSVQSRIKAGGLTFMRLWSYDVDTKAAVVQKVAAAENSGETCIFMLGQTDSLTWLEQTVRWTDSYCHIYEFGNEPDSGNNPDNSNMVTYTNWWIKDIPQLRALAPGALFGGPAMAWSSACCQFTGNYPSDMAYFLAKTAAAGVRADFISYHDYPCTGGGANGVSKAACLANTPGDFQWNWDQVIGWENQYYGGVIPTGVTEYNFDPGTNNLYNWSGDGTFMSQWTQEAIEEMVTLGVSFANEFTSLNFAGYGDLDMFSDAAPYRPKPQFNAMISEIAKYTSLSTQVLVPSNGASLKGKVVLDASAAGPGTVTGVSFDLSGGSLSTPVVVGTAVATLYGWIALWKTTSVANGTYSLQSMATEAGGTTVKSPKITVTVSNKR